jgi:hypothetical protein
MTSVPGVISTVGVMSASGMTSRRAGSLVNCTMTLLGAGGVPTLSCLLGAGARVNGQSARKVVTWAAKSLACWKRKACPASL